MSGSFTLELVALSLCLLGVAVSSLASAGGWGGRRRAWMASALRDDGAQIVQDLRQHRNRQAIVAAMMQSLPVLVAGSLSVHLGHHLAEVEGWNAAVVVTACATLTLSLLLLATRASQWSEAAGLPRGAPSWIRRPLSWLGRAADAVVGVGYWVLRPAGIRPRSPDDHVTEEEIRSLVELGTSEGLLNEEEEELIESIFNLGDTMVREIMVPRPDLVSLPAACPLESALQSFLQSGYSRIPVYEESVDGIAGVLYLKDVLRLLAGNGEREPAPPPSILHLARQPLFIPESKRIDELFLEMRARRIHMAVVVDEFGGTAGIVTMEDILEEMVGEIVDEHDRQTVGPVRLVGDSAVVDARLHVDKVNELLDLQIPPSDGEYDTIGGYVLDRAGRMPQVGESIETEEAVLAVEQMRGRRITRLRITKRGKDDPR